MPRMQSPAGYIRSKEVQEILNVSPAMIREYVTKGKIKHLVPRGRTHGFYLESDVRKLANELDVFLNLEEEAATSSFRIATPADIPAYIALNRELFTDSDHQFIYNEDDTALSKKWVSWTEKNPEIVYVLKRDEEIVGTATILPIKPKSWEKFEKVLLGDISILLGDIDISTEDIEEYKPGKHVRLYLAEIGIKPSIHNDLRRKYGAKLIAKFMDTIVDLGKRGVIIENITAVGATKSGVKLLQHFGLCEVMPPRPDTRLFTLNIKESGSPLILQYKQALQKSGILKPKRVQATTSQDESIPTDSYTTITT
jgi:MerR HTH family regulatory protein